MAESVADTYGHRLHRQQIFPRISRKVSRETRGVTCFRSGIDPIRTMLDTGLGRLKTVHLVKQRDPDDPVTEVWLSPQHQYLPVKMLIIDREMRFEQIIQSVDVRD